MPILNVYKAKTRGKKVKQTYYLGGFSITEYLDGGLIIGYNTPNKKIHSQLNLKKNSKEFDWFKKMIKSTKAFNN